MNTFKLILSWWLLYIFYSLFFIITGIDKFFNYSVDWSIYVNENIPHFLNMSSTIFLYIIGIIEIIIGLLILIKPKMGAYLAITILLAISINLISMGTHYHEGHTEIMTHYDVALHDIGLAIGAYVFLVLTEELNN